MIAKDEDALICDLAETYHIYDYRSLPVRLVATLAAGLRDDSRIASSTTDLKVSITNTLLAIIADRLGQIIQQWATKDLGIKSIFNAIYQIEEEENATGFRSGDAFMQRWGEINKEG